MDVYVAGSYDNRKMMRMVMDALELTGHNITIDWTQYNRTLNVEKLMNYAKLDIDAINKCEVFVFVYDEIKSAGKNFEFGLAYGLGKKIIILADEDASPIYMNIFFGLESLQFVNSLLELNEAISKFKKEHTPKYYSECS